MSKPPSDWPSELIALLRRVDQFLTNGIELGYIKMPAADCPDPARELPGLVKAALAQAPHTNLHGPDLAVGCPDALLPDGPVCPRCGSPRAPSGVGGGSWVHHPRTARGRGFTDVDAYDALKEADKCYPPQPGGGVSNG